MNKLIVIAAILSMIGTTAFANQRIQATVVDMQETYQDVVRRVAVENCKTVDVPIYGGGSANTGDVIVGAIIGGAIGNQFGGGSGKDAMTVLGAIVGADVANKNGGQQEIVGYRQQQQCTTEYEDRTVSVRGNNVVTVETDNGNRYQFNTTGWYARGTVVFLDVTLQQFFTTTYIITIPLVINTDEEVFTPEGDI